MQFLGIVKGQRFSFLNICYLLQKIQVLFKVIDTSIRQVENLTLASGVSAEFSNV